MIKFYIALFLLLNTYTYSQAPCPGIESLLYGSQLYHTVQIGSQCWLKENLSVGNQIPTIHNQSNNDTIEKFCYNDSISNCNVYGGLYQWREAEQYSMKVKTRGICPIGWHIPSHIEYDTLILFVKNGNALLKVGQGSGTNASGFSALLYGKASDYWTSNSDLVETQGGNLGDYDLTPHQFLIYPDGGLDFLQGHTGSTADYNVSIRCLKDTGLFVQSPYGGENWLIGSSHKISWGGDLAGKVIRIEYSTDNGISWLNISESDSAIEGDYKWVIPNTPSKNCKVRITDLNNPNSKAISDNLFTICIDPCPAGSFINHGGKKYNTVVINGKCWFKENVNTGTVIPGSQPMTSNGIIEKYCYNDDTSNCSIYGGLYTYYEMKEKGFCPTFWHPDGIGSPLQQSLYDGNALKAIGQGSGLGSGTDITGFSVLLAGSRAPNGTFINLGERALFPFGYASQPPAVEADYLYATSALISWTALLSFDQGGSARCVRDDLGPLTLKSPVGGENLLIDSTYKITWSYSSVINIKIDFTTDNGLTWLNIIPSIPSSSGSYTWTIPNTPSKNCKVKISSVNYLDTNYISNAFRIYQVPTAQCPGIPTVNYENQIYKTIAIGNQCWMRENLNIGTMIDVTANPSDNGIIEKHCYNNDTANCKIYGGLYQWNEAMQYTRKEGAIGICPIGWHIPTWNEYDSLRNYVGSNGIDLREIGQGGGTNATGFSALLAGLSYRGTFGFFNSNALFWTSRISSDTTFAYNFQLIGSDTIIFESQVYKIAGYSIRCINDSLVSALPVELTSFIASIINNNVKLSWNTATEVNTASFEIERKQVNYNSWVNIASIKASGNSTTPKEYSYIDKNVNTGKYNYRLKMIDLDGSYKYSNIINAEIALPAKFELSNAYPNPWNPTTTIRYQVPTNILVTIKVFDALGREVSTLINEVKPAGSYEVTFNAKGLSSGTYYYQMKAGTYIETKKIILLK